jgi:hypothetical protein
MSKKNKIENLRDHLFEQLERLSDDSLDLDKEAQKAACIVQFIKATQPQNPDSQFFLLGNKNE